MEAFQLVATLMLSKAAADMIDALHSIRSQKVRDHLKGTCSVLVEVQMMTRTRMKVRREFGVSVVGSSRFVEDTFTVAIADNVVCFTSDGLRERN